MNKTKEEKLNQIENQKRILVTILILIFIMYLTSLWSFEICEDISGNLTCDSKKQWLWLFEIFILITLYYLNKRFIVKKPVNNFHPLESKTNFNYQKSNKYNLDDNLPPVIKNKKGDNNFYKKDFKGLQEYLKEVPNMDRIFNEFTYSIRNGLTVKSYLKEAKLLEDPEVSNVALKGFSDIQEFLEGMYSINKNDELNKDISACKEAIQIIQNYLSYKISNDIDMDFDEEYFKIDKSIMSIDSYKEVYPFLKEFREKLKTGEIWLEEMESFIINRYNDLDGDKIMYTISLFEQLEYILATHLNDWEEKNDNVYKGFVDIEQYHSLSQKTIIILRNLLFKKISDLGKKL